MNRLIISLVALLLALLWVRTHAHADQKFYDSRGNHVSTTSRDSAGNERYYDNRGNSLGTSSPTSNGRNYYDQRGNRTGTSTRH